MSVDNECLLERSVTTKESIQDIIPLQIQQQISETNAAHARALRGQEQLVTELRKQILNINEDLIERQRNFSLREAELQSEITQAQEMNRSLMEENESYQMLLHEKSMNGEFMQTSIMKVHVTTKRGPEERREEHAQAISGLLGYVV